MASDAKRWMWTVVFLLAPFAVSVAGGALTLPEIGGWYAHLAKSPLNPPAWVFGPVWTALFAMMAAAGVMVYREAPRGQVRGPLALHAAQLLFNLGWSYVFFHLHSPGWATAEILVLWALILATLVAFWRLLPLAGALLVPYLAWVSFATYLTLSVALLNR
jgi:translocator protein